MKGPYEHYSTKSASKADMVLTTFVVGLIAFFFFMAWFMYISMYNEAMVQCLAEHSKDVCVETLR